MEGRGLARWTRTCRRVDVVNCSWTVRCMDCWNSATSTTCRWLSSLPFPSQDERQRETERDRDREVHPLIGLCMQCRLQIPRPVTTVVAGEGCWTFLFRGPPSTTSASALSLFLFAAHMLSSHHRPSKRSVQNPTGKRVSRSIIVLMAVEEPPRRLPAHLFESRSAKVLLGWISWWGRISKLSAPYTHH